MFIQWAFHFAEYNNSKKNTLNNGAGFSFEVLVLSFSLYCPFTHTHTLFIHISFSVSVSIKLQWNKCFFFVLKQNQHYLKCNIFLYFWYVSKMCFLMLFWWSIYTVNMKFYYTEMVMEIDFPNKKCLYCFVKMMTVPLKYHCCSSTKVRLKLFTIPQHKFDSKFFLFFISISDTIFKSFFTLFANYWIGFFFCLRKVLKI